MRGGQASDTDAWPCPAHGPGPFRGSASHHRPLLSPTPPPPILSPHPARADSEAVGELTAAIEAGFGPCAAVTPTAACESGHLLVARPSGAAGAGAGGWAEAMRGMGARLGLPGDAAAWLDEAFVA